MPGQYLGKEGAANKGIALTAEAWLWRRLCPIRKSSHIQSSVYYFMPDISGIRTLLLSEEIPTAC